MAQALRRRGCFGTGAGDWLPSCPIARQFGSAVANPAAVGRRDRCRLCHTRRCKIATAGIAADQVPGAIRPYGGTCARPLVRHWSGLHRRHADRDIATLERRSGAGGSDPDRSGDSDLPAVYRGGVAAPTHNGHRRRRSAPEKPLAYPSRQVVAGDRDRVPDHHLSEHTGSPYIRSTFARRGRPVDGIERRTGSSRGARRSRPRPC